MDEHASADDIARGRLDDCWRKIGVQGDRSCPELARHVHCRNCPVYVSAAERLLHRPLPADYLATWTERYATATAPRASAGESVFVFRVGAEWLALPTRALESVATPRPVRSLPHRRSDVVLGVVNIRGELLVCVSLAHVLGVDATPPGATATRAAYERLLVLGRGLGRFVAPVDEVHGTVRYAAGALVRPPETLARAASRFTTMLLPWSDTMVGCLDDALLFAALERSLA